MLTGSRFAPLVLLALLLAGCDDDGGLSVPLPHGGDPARGAQLIRHYGCGGCHIVPGIRGANGLVGPPLNMMGRRVYIAGVLRNTADNMTTWIEKPQQVVPGNAMPDMGISATDARDITSYLYTLQ
jgi:cytochrome c2